MSLRWEKTDKGWTAYQGKRRVGFVGERRDGSVHYDVSYAVYMNGIAKPEGEVKSIATGKGAVERAWQRWLDAFELMEMTPEYRQDREYHRAQNEQVEAAMDVYHRAPTNKTPK